MAPSNKSVFSRFTGLFRSGPLPRVSPYTEAGVGGTSVYGGLIVSKEKDARLVGQQKWITFADLMTNTSIVAAGTRYLLNLVANAQWQVEPANDSPEAQKIADLIEEIINDCATPWRRIVRRSAMYRFHGFGIQEWTAKKREDGKIGFDDIEARPPFTIERWEMDDNGSVVGVWQRAPMGGDLIYLPRSKILYLVDDTLTDSPEGLGVYRHLIEPWERLKKYFELEGRGFERDLRGTPIGRVPYSLLNNAVAAKKITEAQANSIIKGIEDFVKMQAKSNDTGLLLDSVPYIYETDSGQSLSGTMQYGIELLQGGSVGFAEMGAAIDRTVLEIARIIGVEHLLLGDKGGGSRALSEDKSQNFYLVVNGALEEIADACNKDIIEPICNLNGIKDELRPKLKHSDIAFRSVTEITASLAQMATAGAVLRPDDPAINDVRDMLGIERAPEMSAEDMGIYQQQQQAKAGIKFGPDGKPVDPVKVAEATARAKAQVATGVGGGAGGKSPPGSPTPETDQPSAKEGGKGSKGKQDITKFFDLDDIDSWDEDFAKSNPNQPRDAHGRFARGFGSGSRIQKPTTIHHPNHEEWQTTQDVHDMAEAMRERFNPNYKAQHKKVAEPVTRVKNLKSKLSSTLDWLKSDTVKETIKNHAVYLAKENIIHIVGSLLDAVSEHHTGETLDEDIHGLISNLVHNRSIEGVTIGQTRSALHLGLKVLARLRNKDIEKAEEDPVVEILDALDEAISELPDDMEKAFNPNQVRDSKGRWSKVGSGAAPLQGKTPGSKPLSMAEYVQAVQEYEDQWQAARKLRSASRFNKLKQQLGDKTAGVAEWFKTDATGQVLKDHLTTLAREGIAQLTSYLIREAAKKQNVRYDPKVDKLVERTVLGEAQQKDITIGQARATVKLAFNLLKSFRKGQIEKVEVDGNDPVIAVLDFLLETIDDMDVQDSPEVQKIVKFVDDGTGIEIVAEELGSNEPTELD